MSTVLAFDVYGTLIDPLGISRRLEEFAGDKTQALAQLWRDKQIEYLFRRALAHDYQPFSVCTRQALDFAAAQLEVSIAAPDRETLLGKYRELPAYDEVSESLQTLKNAGYRNYAFSNGEPDDLACLLRHARLEESLDGIISVHAVRSFKPDPAVYRHFIECTGASPADTWLVSGNAFDVIGADNAGWRTAWVRRNPAALFDPWGIEPTVTVGDTSELPGRLGGG